MILANRATVKLEPTYNLTTYEFKRVHRSERSQLDGRRGSVIAQQTCVGV